MAKEEVEKPKYGINELAQAMGSKPHLVRIKLRRKGIEREEGKTYGWNTKTELEDVIKLLNAEAKSPTEKKAKAEKKAPAAKKTITKKAA